MPVQHWSKHVEEAYALLHNHRNCRRTEAGKEWQKLLGLPERTDRHVCGASAVAPDVPGRGPLRLQVQAPMTHQYTYA